MYKMQDDYDEEEAALERRRRLAANLREILTRAKTDVRAFATQQDLPEALYKTANNLYASLDKALQTTIKELMV